MLQGQSSSRLDMDCSASLSWEQALSSSRLPEAKLWRQQVINTGVAIDHVLSPQGGSHLTDSSRVADQYPRTKSHIGQSSLQNILQLISSEWVQIPTERMSNGISRAFLLTIPIFETASSVANAGHIVVLRRSETELEETRRQVCRARNQPRRVDPKNLRGCCGGAEHHLFRFRRDRSQWP